MNELKFKVRKIQNGFVLKMDGTEIYYPKVSDIIENAIGVTFFDENDNHLECVDFDIIIAPDQQNVDKEIVPEVKETTGSFESLPTTDEKIKIYNPRHKKITMPMITYYKTAGVFHVNEEARELLALKAGDFVKIEQNGKFIYLNNEVRSGASVGKTGAAGKLSFAGTAFLRNLGIYDKIVRFFIGEFESGSGWRLVKESEIENYKAVHSL